MNVECLAYAHKHDLTMCSVPVDTRGKENKDEKWRKEKALQITYQKRPDLLETYKLTEHEKEILEKIVKYIKDNGGTCLEDR